MELTRIATALEIGTGTTNDRFVGNLPVPEHCAMVEQVFKCHSIDNLRGLAEQDAKNSSKQSVTEVSPRAIDVSCLLILCTDQFTSEFTPPVPILMGVAIF